MIYIVNNNQGKFIKSEIDICDIPSWISIHIKSKTSLSDYYVLIDDVKYCLIGFLNSNYPAYFNMDKAFEEWQADLEWLKQNFNL